MLQVIKVVTEDTLINPNIILFSSMDVVQQGLDTILAQFKKVGTNHYQSEFVDVDAKVALNTNAANASIDDKPLFHESIVIQPKPTLMASLVDFTLLKMDTDATNNWLLNLFTIINTRINPKKLFTKEEIQKLLWKKIKSDYRTNAKRTMDDLMDNPSFKLLFGRSEDTESNMIRVLENPKYRIAGYEIKILSTIVGMNVFMTSRKTQRAPDRMRCVGKLVRDYYIMLHQHVGEDKCFEFHLYTKNGHGHGPGPGHDIKKYLLSRSDFDAKFSKCVQAKCTMGFVSGDVDDVCPPYK